MTRITLDADLRRKLLDLSHPLELCDESGLVLARLLPNPAPELFENLGTQVDEQEIQRRKRDKGKSYSTSEVLAYLETL